MNVSSEPAKFKGVLVGSGSAIAGHVIKIRPVVARRVAAGGGSREIVTRYLAAGFADRADVPGGPIGSPPSRKYSVCVEADPPAAGTRTRYLIDSSASAGVDRRSASTDAATSTEALCSKPLLAVRRPTGSSPKTAIMQKAPMPMATVTSINENACKCRSFIAGTSSSDQSCQ